MHTMCKRPCMLSHTHNREGAMTEDKSGKVINRYIYIYIFASSLLEDLRRERCPTPTLSQVDRPRGPGIKVSCHFDNVQVSQGLFTHKS